MWSQLLCCGIIASCGIIIFDGNASSDRIVNYNDFSSPNSLSIWHRQDLATDLLIDLVQSQSLRKGRRPLFAHRPEYKATRLELVPQTERKDE